MYSQSRLATNEADEKRLLREAAGLFARVVQRDGSHAPALFNWGLVLAVLADRADARSAEQLALYAEACQRFQQLSQVLQAEAECASWPLCSMCSSV